MDYINLIRNHNKDGYLKGIHIETFILNLLEYDSEISNRKFSKNYGFTSSKHNYQFNFDAIYKEGINGLEGPVLVEIKYRFNINDIVKIKAILDKVEKKYNFLLIIPDIISQGSLDNIKKRLNVFIPANSYEIWDKSNIDKLISKHPEKAKEIFENLGYFLIKRAGEIGEFNTDWFKKQLNLIDNIRRDFLDDNLFLFMGAGVSIDAGVPGWTDLLEKLNIAILRKSMTNLLSEKETNILSKTLSKIHSDSPLIMASYIKQALNDKFADEIKEVMYENIKDIQDQKQLKSIAKALKPKKGKFGIRGVITYNFDDLLEKQLSSINVDFRSIYSEGFNSGKTELGIFHVHGFIPTDESHYQGLERSNLVFSEDGYHFLQNDPYSWSNLLQLWALQEYSVLMIGLSGIDPNLRRLLNIFSKRNEEKKHYILLKRELQERPPNISELKFDEFSNLHHGIIESTFIELGVIVLWYKDHDEIGKIIDKICE